MILIEHVVRCDDCATTARDTLGRSAGEVREVLAQAGWSAEGVVDRCPRCTLRVTREANATVVNLGGTVHQATVSGPGRIIRGGEG